MKIVGLILQKSPVMPQESDATSNLPDLTVEQLREYAAAHGINLQGAKKKEDILLAINNGVSAEE